MYSLFDREISIRLAVYLHQCVFVSILVLGMISYLLVKINIILIKHYIKIDSS